MGWLSSIFKSPPPPSPVELNPFRPNRSSERRLDRQIRVGSAALERSERQRVLTGNIVEDAMGGATRRHGQ